MVKGGVVLKVLLLYDTIVKPDMFYGVFVWYNTALATKVKSLQRSAFISMCVALSSTPTIALNVIVHIVPIDKAGRCMAVRVAVEFK